MENRIAAVTGANRGLGWGTAQALAGKEFKLILLGRKKAELDARLDELLPGAALAAVELDLEQPESVEQAARRLKELCPGGLDLLVNNAGVFLETDGSYSPEKSRRTMQINALGPLQLTLALGDLLRRKKGLVVNVSSGMGALAEMNGGYPGYRMSKTALNAATRYLSEEWKSSGVRVNSVCPGWVRTEMGGAGADRSIEEGVKSIMFGATLPADGPTGGFFRDGKPLAW